MYHRRTTVRCQGARIQHWILPRTKFGSLEDDNIRKQSDAFKHSESAYVSFKVVFSNKYSKGLFRQKLKLSIKLMGISIYYREGVAEIVFSISFLNHLTFVD